MVQQEAFILLTLQNATIWANKANYMGTLALECVTVSTDPDSKAATSRDVFLVVRLDSFETPLDPSVPVTCAVKDAYRRYTFQGGSGEKVQLSFPDPPDTGATRHLREDFETFDSILSQYSEFTYSTPQNASPQSTSSIAEKQRDLRGHVVLVNQDNGEVVGELDSKITIKEDPSMNEKGREKEPVILEIPEGGEDARTAFVRAIPPEEQDMITKGASLISYAISGSTNLLLTAITSASNYVIKNTNPHPSANQDPNAPRDPNNPPPLPPRAVVFLTSSRTRQGLQTVHAMSGQAVQLSAKTVGVLDGMIKRFVGKKDKGKGRAPATNLSASTLSPGGVTPRSSSPVPPPYAEKPLLPPRNGSRAPSPQPSSQPPPLPPREKLGTKARLILSADLILSTIDNSARQIIEVGGQHLNAVVGHKYGAEAAQSASMMTGTAKNVGLVYIDMRGVGRKALVKRVGKEYVKSRFSSSKDKAGDTGGYAVPAGGSVEKR